MNKFLYFCFYCHRRPDRSFYFFGHKFPVCARCTGIIIGYAVGIALLSSGLVRSFLPCLLLLPMIIDGYGQLLGKWESTNLRRLFTGIAGGIGVIYFIYFCWEYPYRLGIMFRTWVSGN